MQPKLKIGILSNTQIKFILKGEFIVSSTHQLLPSGCYTAFLFNGEIKIIGNNIELIDHSLLLRSLDDSTFVLQDVKIGIQFHWERLEDQQFCGDLSFVVDGDNIVAINHAPIEQYLTSVISSEMSATSSPELLKAHAVISRSWVMAQVEKNQQIITNANLYESLSRTETEIVRWYDREDHRLFDVCADDHCQRYQGIGRVSNVAVDEAIAQTRGLVLTYDGKMCDARFSKCCGGVSELFENCWEPIHHNYLESIQDVDKCVEIPDLTTELGAREWIMDQSQSFCNTNDATVLKQVLNNYDQETANFYRWRVKYDQEEISELIKQRTGIDFGVVEELIPLERGASGRIVRLKIVGSNQTMIIGKELEIRKALSSTHLYSSAFVVEKTQVDQTILFTLHGAGWGHGVGLCQIGAAVMGDKGYSFREILSHYFKGAQLVQKY